MIATIFSVYIFIYRKVIISPTHTCNSEDSNNDEPPLVKHCRLQNLQKEREEEKFRLEQPAFTGLDDVQGPASQQVLKFVVSVRRRLDFSQTLTQTTSSDDSSHESTCLGFIQLGIRTTWEGVCLCTLLPQKGCLHGPTILNSPIDCALHVAGGNLSCAFLFRLGTSRNGSLGKSRYPSMSPALLL